MKCLETRRTPEGYRRRRYLAEDGKTRVSTIEVPLEVWRGINRQGRDRNRAAAWSRARSRDALRARAAAYADLGWKAAAVAQELDVPLRTIQRWRKP